MALLIGNKQILVNSNFDVNSKKVINVLSPYNDTDAANKKYVDDKQSSSVSIYTINDVVENTLLGTLNSGLTLGMMYITNTGNTTAYINLGTTTTGNEINEFDVISIPPDEVISITINRRLSNTENKNLYISADSWLGVDLKVEWALITYESQINGGGGLLVQSGYNVYLYNETATDYYIGNGDTAGLSTKGTETNFVYYDETTGRLSYGSGAATPINDVFHWDSNKYTPYSASTAGSFDTSITPPTDFTRLNYNGYFYSTRLYEGDTRVVTVNPTPSVYQVTIWSNGNSVQGSSKFTWNDITLGITGDITFSNGANRTIKIADASSGNGNLLSIKGSSGALVGGGIGGIIDIIGGTIGDEDNGGPGGFIKISGGVGGEGIHLANFGGTGGSTIIKGGSGGDGIDNAVGGNGGNVYIYGGDGTNGEGGIGNNGNVYFGTENGVGRLPISGITDTEIIYYDSISGKISYGSFYNGNVSKIGTPTNNQIAVWTDSSSIEGTNGLTYDNNTGILSVISGITFISGSTRTIKIEDKTTAGSGSDTQILGQTSVYTNAWAAGGALKLYGGNGNNVGTGGGDGGTTVIRGGSGGNADDGNGGNGGSVQIIGGSGGSSESSSSGEGGDVFIYGGTGVSTGDVYFGTGSVGKLPAASTSNVVYYNSGTGKISYGTISGAGLGDVSKTGTPLNDQVAVWTGSNTIEGTAGLTYSVGGILTVSNGITFSTSGSYKTIQMGTTNSLTYPLYIVGQSNNVINSTTVGGSVIIRGGEGVGSSGSAGGGAGGDVNLTGGQGGVSSTGSDGAGGDVYITGGNAGGASGTGAYGGNVYIYGGTNTSTNGDIYFGDGSTGKLPATSTSNVVYYNSTTGKISYGAISGVGIGDVSKTGTPLNDQVAVWTGSNTIEGTAGLTYSTSGILTVSNGITLSTGGSRTIKMGDTSSTTYTLNIVGQSNNTTNSSTPGGDINIIAGSGVGSSGAASGGAGGELLLNGGDGGSSVTGTDGAGGNVYITGGNAGGSSSGAYGGSIYIYGGTNGAGDGNIYFGDGSTGKLPLQTTSNILYYNTTTGKITYGESSSVSKTGTISANQIAIWNSDGVLKGSSKFTYDGTSFFQVGDTSTRNTFRISGGNSSGNYAPVLELFRSGVHSNYIATVGNYMTFGFNSSSYNDADLTSAYGMTLDNSGNFNVKTSISVGGNNIGNIYATKLANILYVTSTPTLNSTHNNMIISCDSGGGFGNYSINLPTGMATGWQITIINVGSGIITVNSSAPLLQSKGYYKLIQYAAASTFYNGTNYYLFGDLSA
jgi:hypothetical protein